MTFELSSSSLRHGMMCSYPFLFLSQIRDPGNIKPMIADKQWIKNLLQDGPRTPTSPGNANSSGDEQNANNRLQSRIETLTDKLLHMEKANRQLELDNETLGFKVRSQHCTLLIRDADFQKDSHPTSSDIQNTYVQSKPPTESRV